MFIIWMYFSVAQRLIVNVTVVSLIPTRGYELLIYYHSGEMKNFPAMVKRQSVELSFDNRHAINIFTED